MVLNTYVLIFQCYAVDCRLKKKKKENICSIVIVNDVPVTEGKYIPTSRVKATISLMMNLSSLSVDGSWAGTEDRFFFSITFLSISCSPHKLSNGKADIETHNQL